MSQLSLSTFTTTFEECRKLLVKNSNMNVGWSRIDEVPSEKTKEAVMLWMHWNLKVEEEVEEVSEEGNNEWSLRINLRSGSCSQPSSLVH